MSSVQLSTDSEEPVPYHGKSKEENENGFAAAQGISEDPLEAPMTDQLRQELGVTNQPIVDQHDRMWAEVDVLDDAQKLANQVKVTGSFFGPAHAEALENLRQGQIELAHKTADVEAHKNQQQFNELWQNGDITSLRRVLFDERYFDQVTADVKSCVERLDQVSTLMRAVDEQSKELWNALSANEITTFDTHKSIDEDAAKEDIAADY